MSYSAGHAEEEDETQLELRGLDGKLAHKARTEGTREQQHRHHTHSDAPAVKKPL